MNFMTILGIILIVIGIVGLIYGGITYTSSRDVVDMGSVHLQVDQERQVPVSPIAGGVALTAGIILIVVGRRRHAVGRAV